MYVLPSYWKTNWYFCYYWSLKIYIIAINSFNYWWWFNLNLLDNSDVCTDFLSHLHACSQHPVITFPTRVIDFSSTLIDNFHCDISLLPVSANVLETDIGDHYLIEINFNLTTKNNFASKLNNCVNTKLKFSYKLRTADRTPLNNINNVDLVFNYLFLN